MAVSLALFGLASVLFATGFLLMAIVVPGPRALWVAGGVLMSTGMALLGAALAAPMGAV